MHVFLRLKMTIPGNSNFCKGIFPIRNIERKFAKDKRKKRNERKKRRKKSKNSGFCGNLAFASNWVCSKKIHS
jgi:hypothetical protein